MPVLLNRKNIFNFFIGIFILIFIGSVAFAEGTGGIVPCKGMECKFEDLFTLMQNFAKVALPVINTVAIGLITWAGIQMITAGDDANKFKNAQKIIWAVAIGIIIIYGAKFLITSFVQGLTGKTVWFEQKTENIYNNDQ